MQIVSLWPEFLFPWWEGGGSSQLEDLPKSSLAASSTGSNPSCDKMDCSSCWKLGKSWPSCPSSSCPALSSSWRHHLAINLSLSVSGSNGGGGSGVVVREVVVGVSFCGGWLVKCMFSRVTICQLNARYRMPVICCCCWCQNSYDDHERFYFIYRCLASRHVHI